MKLIFKLKSLNIIKRRKDPKNLIKIKFNLFGVKKNFFFFYKYLILFLLLNIIK